MRYFLLLPDVTMSDITSSLKADLVMIEMNGLKFQLIF